MDPKQSQPGAPPELRLRFFGSFEGRRGEVPLPRTRTRKGVWLLALLALRHGRPADRSWLAGTLWPEASEESALAYLRSGLYDIRRVLGPDAARLSSPSSRAVRLDLGGAGVDLLEYDALIERGDIASLERAVVLYRAPLLEGCTEEWVLGERASREQAFLQALEAVAADRLARGEPHEAARLLHRAIPHDPLRESVHRSLMEALARCGDYAAVHRHYRDLRHALLAEVNAEPSEQTQAAYRRLQAEGRGPVGHGDSPPTAAPRRRLPCPLAPLIGRVEEVREVSALLHRGRLVSLTGTGGVGKTRLAIAVAEAVSAAFADGVWFVDLSALSDPETVAGAVGEALGLGEGTRPVVEVLLAELGAKSLLLVLDNCEHLLGAVSPLAARILDRCPEARVLATSRERLGLGGEVAWRVPSLAVPEERELLGMEQSCRELPAAGLSPARALAWDAVRLFVQRAAEVAPGFRPGPADLVTIGRICRRLDGVPLAIELAAARAGVLPVSQILARLDDSFRLLTHGSRAIPRQQTLRATIEWSHRLLTPLEQALLRRLCVFSGGWTLEAAEAIAGDPGLALPYDDSSVALGGTGPWEASVDPEVVHLLGSLADKSLVQYDPSAQRYHLLETVREYAAEQLTTSGEERDVRRRHLRYYAALAGGVAERTAEVERLDAVDVLAAEQENLRAALAWSVREEPETGLRLVISLDGFWKWRSRLGEGCDWVRRLLTACPEPPAELCAAAYVRLAIWTEWQGAFEAAAAWYRQGLAAARTAGEPLYTALALYGLGLICRQQGDYRQAAAFVEESAAFSREAGRDWDYLRAQTELGSLCHSLGDDERAGKILADCLEVARRLGYPRHTAAVLDQLGDLARDQGDHASARAFHLEKLALVRAAGLHELVVYAFNDLALLAWLTGDRAEAGAFVTEALSVARQTGSPRLQTICLSHLARLAYETGDLEALRSTAYENLELAWRAQEMGRVVAALHRIAALALARDEAVRAVRLLSAADRLEAAHGPVTHFGEHGFRSEILAAARARLDVPVFIAAEAEGRTLPPEHVVQEALRWAGSGPRVSAAEPAGYRACEP